jgi:hypothetical protein
MPASRTDPKGVLDPQGPPRQAAAMTPAPPPLTLSAIVERVAEHLKVYLLSGTLAAVGIDVATNVTDAMGGAMGGAMAPMGMNPLVASHPVALAVQAVGAAIFVAGATLYAANIWCGFRALRLLRFRFVERGPILKICGWSFAFLYLLGSVVVGAAVNAVYLALVD